MPVSYVTFSFSSHVWTSFKDSLELLDDSTVRHQDNVDLSGEITRMKKVVNS